MFEKVLSSFFVLLVSTKGQNSFPTVCNEDQICYKGSWNLLALNSTIRYAAFKGIRFAEPPLGDLRFKSPLAYKVKGNRNISNPPENVRCAQLEAGRPIGEEDCLVLNIYVPENVINNKNDEKLPVMIWIHGGGLMTGSGSLLDYDPVYLVNKNVAIVTINYRLGPFGFLSMGTDSVPGNAGFRDQVMAMKWVQENIADFGGDPDSVTIFGESAGALSTSTHLLSPMSEGLFQRAILQSGMVNKPGLPNKPEKAVEFAASFTEKLGCNSLQKEEDDVLKCLQRKSKDDILAQTNFLGSGRPWMAVSDSGFTSNPFLPGDPDELMASGQFNSNIELIIGNNGDDGILYYLGFYLGAESWEDLRNEFETKGPVLLFNIANSSDITTEDVEKANQIMEYYFGSIDNVNAEHNRSYIDMMTDDSVLFGTHKIINNMVKYGVKVFQYFLTYQGEYSFSQNFGIDPIGVCHADDLIYLWGLPTWPIGTLNEADEEMRSMMTTVWTNFAKYGDPTPPDSGFSWIPQAPNEVNQYWEISGPDPKMTTNQDIQKRMAFWERTMG